MLLLQSLPMGGAELEEEDVKHTFVYCWKCEILGMFSRYDHCPEFRKK